MPEIGFVSDQICQYDQNPEPADVGLIGSRNADLAFCPSKETQRQTTILLVWTYGCTLPQLNRGQALRPPTRLIVYENNEKSIGGQVWLGTS